METLTAQAGGSLVGLATDYFVRFAEGSSNRVRAVTFDRSGASATAVYAVNFDATSPKPGTLDMGHPLGWPVISTAPVADYLHSSVILNGRIYWIGGLSGSGEVYHAPINKDGSLGDWTGTTGIGNAMKALAGAAVYNGRIYMVGGASGDGSGSSSNKVVYSQPDANGNISSWTDNSVYYLPASAGHGMRAVVLNGFLYAIGGDLSNDKTNVSSYVYVSQIKSDGSLGAWRNTAFLPGKRTIFAAGVWGNRIFIVGGHDGSGYQNTVYSAAPVDAAGSLGDWRAETVYPLSNGYIANAVFFNNRLYVAGGNNGSALNQVYYSTVAANGTLSVWTEDTSLSAGGAATLYGHALATYNNRIYALGGNAGGAPTANVYMADFPMPGVASTANGELAVSFNAASADSGGSGLHASPNRIEISTSPDCNGSSNKDSGWQGGTSYTGTALSTSAPYFVRINARDNAGNTSLDSRFRGNDGGTVAHCFGPFWPQDNTPPKPPVMSETQPASWLASNALPAGISSHTAIVVSSMVYIIAGNNGSGDQNTVYSANIALSGVVGAWSASADPSLTARSGHASVMANNRIYALGGATAGADVRFVNVNGDGTLGSWTATSALPRSLSGHSAVALNNRIYALGGDSGGSIRSEVYSASINNDGSLGAWAPTVSLSSPSAHHCSVAYTNKIYVIGGDHGVQHSDVYLTPVNADGSLGPWAKTTSLPQALNAFSCVIFNSRLYVIGGAAPGGAQAGVYSASINNDGTLGSWSATSSLSAAKSNLSAVVFSNRIYAFGGSADSSSVYSASITLSGVSIPQGRDLSVALALEASDNISGHATPNQLVVSTNPTCVPEYTNTGWFSGLTGVFSDSLTGDTSYYLFFKGRDASGLVSNTLGADRSQGPRLCAGPYWVAPAVYALADNAAPGSAGQGARFSVLRLKLWAETGTASYLSGLNVARLGTMADADVQDISLWYDNNLNGTFEEGSDSRISNLAQFTNAGAALSVLAGQQAADITVSTKTYFVVVGALPNALPGNTLGVRVSGVDSFTFATKHKVRGLSFPVDSGVTGITDNASVVIVASSISLISYQVTAGQSNVGILGFTLSPNAGTVELSSVTIRKLGSASDGDISAIRLWRDNGDGAFAAAGPGQDILLGPVPTFIDAISTYNVTHANQSTRTVRSGATVYFFISLDIAPGTALNNTLGIEITSTDSFKYIGALDSMEAGSMFPIRSSTGLITMVPDVTAQRSTGTWHGDPFFIFSSQFGTPPLVDHVHYAWNQSATYNWPPTHPSEPEWNSGKTTMTATANGAWYFHTKAYRAAADPGATRDFGPFNFDSSAPAITNVECRQKDEITWIPASAGMTSANISTPTIKASVQDANAGLVNGAGPFGVSSGTVLYLDFDSWPLADKSGFAQTVSTVGAASVVPGKFNDGLDGFSSANYIVVSTISQLAGVTEMTVEAWLNPGAMGANSHIASFLGGQPMTLGANGEMSQGNAAAGRDHAAKGQWQYIAWVWSPNNNKIYLNGREIFTDATQGAQNFSQDLWIGYLPGGSAFSGVIDELRASRRALTPEQIAANYFSGARKFTRDGGATWIIDPSTRIAQGSIGLTGSNGSTGVETASGAVSFWNAHSTDNRMVFLIRDQAGNVATSPVTTVAIPYSAPVFTLAAAEPKDGLGFSATESAGVITVNDLTPNVRVTVQAGSPSPLRISSAPISISSDTVLYLDFEEWPPMDKSGWGNHISSVAGNAAQGSGIRGSGAILNASADHLTIPRNPSLNFSAMTVMAWVKTTETAARSIISENGGSDDGFSLALANAGAGKPGFYSGAAWIDAAGSAVADGQWHFLAATYGGGTARIYVDGQLAGSSVMSGDLSAINPLYIGANAASGALAPSAALDEIKLVRRALGDDEIWAEFNGSRFKFSTDGGATFISSFTWSGLTSISTMPPNYNVLTVPSPCPLPQGARGGDGCWSSVLLISSQTPFFQESATNNKLRVIVMDAIGNLASRDLTIALAASSPSISNDRVSNAWGSTMTGTSANWTNTFVPNLIFDLQDQGSGLSSPPPVIPAQAGIGPLLYLPFDEGAGSTALDLSSNGAVGALSGGPSWTSGIFGGALRFDVNKSVDVTAVAPANSLTAVSVEAWIKTGAGGSSGMILNKRDGSGGFDLSLAANGALTFCGNATCAAGNTAVNDGRWRFVVATNDGADTKFYIDGVLDRSQAQAETLSTSRVIQVAGGATAIIGSIDEIRIFNAALSAGNIAADFRRGIARTHEVAISSDSGANYYRVHPDSVVITGADGSNGVETLTGKLSGNLAGQASTSYQRFAEGSANRLRLRAYDQAGRAETSVYTINVDVTPALPGALAMGSPLGWPAISTSPADGYGGSAVILNGRVYVLGKSGANGVYHAPVNKDGTLGAWSAASAALPAAGQALHSAAVFNGRIYVLGGAQSLAAAAPVATVVYATPDSVTGNIASWTNNGANYLPAALGAAAAVAMDGFLYVIGGDTTGSGASGASSAVYMAKINADGSLGAWRLTSALPAALIQHGAVVAGRRIYVTG
ncbi:MAG: LamG-like jellyroll fold domain-containing protein, partial [Elusimicrobiota bacterium]